MSTLPKISVWLLSFLMLIVLTGNKPIQAQKKGSKKLVYQSTVQCLQDSIRWYKTNWKLNENLLSKKHQLEEARTCQ